jgi:methionyl-tRNA formyltransferase
LLVATLDALEAGDLTAVPQSPDGVSLAPKIEVADARVDWRQPVLAVDRAIRACTPAPGAWTTFRGERLKLGPVEPVGTPEDPAEAALKPGELLVERRRVLVGTATRPVMLGEVQPQGKRPMPADAWARGVRPAGGETMDTDEETT